MQPFYVGRAGPELRMQQESAVHVRPIVLFLLLLACATRFDLFPTEPSHLTTPVRQLPCPLSQGITSAPTIAERHVHDVSHQPKSSTREGWMMHDGLDGSFGLVLACLQ